MNSKGKKIKCAIDKRFFRETFVLDAKDVAFNSNEESYQRIKWSVQNKKKKIKQQNRKRKKERKKLNRNEKQA